MRYQASGNLDTNGFMLLMMRTLKAAWGEDWGTFCEAFPNGLDPQNVKLPAITYMFKSKVPGVVGKDTREIKPRYRETYDLPQDNNTSADKVSIYAQVFDYELVFEVWEENNSRLTELAERFEDFMMTYSGYFMQKGVGQVIFSRMLNGYESKMWRDNLVCRHYTYLVRLEKQVVVPQYVIKEIIGKVELVDSIDGSDQTIESINFES